MGENVFKVTKILMNTYILESKYNRITAVASGNIKKKGNIIVGDLVKAKESYDKYVIDEVIDRKNYFIRPPVANIDQMIIVISVKNPMPDYMLLDKEIILCLSKNIVPIICVNKIDLLEENDKELEYIKKVYGSLGLKIVYTSINDLSSIDSLKELLSGKVSAFSGNSGVGKSSITKMIIGEEKEIEVGDIGKKTGRGKHTTKYVELYTISKDTYILDTPGFSSYELYGITHKELKNYYNEFNKCKCDFEDCAHVVENSSVCDVKSKVENGIIDKDRYERYVYIYTKLKEQYDRRYK